ncbi:MAG: MEMO1 family protein [Euryarchaeota archaeon]|nr:MEMO1 family protein [Euryarchaeota archaeon]
MRQPAVAGQFYPGTESGLDSLIPDLFLHPIGPGAVPKLRIDGPRKIEGGIVPHAGYIFSGPVAAHFYRELAMDGFPETFIIIGPNHYGLGAGVAVSMEDFVTPYGVAQIDEELASAVAKDIVAVDENAHRYEHSIEVQIPFLQFFKRDIRIVPITMLTQEETIAVELGRIIKTAVEETGRDVVIIASSDFSHYVPKKSAYKKDARAIEKIVDRDVSGLYRVIYRYKITMCGYGPIAAMLSATGGEVKFLKYATSGDVQPMDEVVGYAAFKVERRR